MYEDRRSNGRYDVEEMGLGWVRLANDITMDIEVSWAQNYDGSESSKVLGSKGGLRLDPLSYFSTLGDVEMNSTFDLKSSDFRWHATDPSYSAYDGPQEHWIATLQGRVPGIDTAALALATALISEGIYLSSQLGREVTIDEVRDRSVSTSLTNL
jgi:predicted dehydrogenase